MYKVYNLLTGVIICFAGPFAGCYIVALTGVFSSKLHWYHLPFGLVGIALSVGGVVGGISIIMHCEKDLFAEVRKWIAK